MRKPRTVRPTAVGRELKRCIDGMTGRGMQLSTVARVAPTVARFGEFAACQGVSGIRGISTDVAAGFIHSRLDSGLAATPATMHDRRSSLRLVFGVARELGLIDGDPTLDLRLPPRGKQRTRPLTSDEIELGRDAALWNLSSRRMAAAWALAEATARGAELSTVSVEDLDLEAGTVWLHGGKRTADRWGSLSEWGVRVLRGRLEEIDAFASIVCAGKSNGISGQVSSCSAISAILIRAGLAGEPDVRPSSVAGWAARNSFDRGDAINEVARMLGVPSLDQAAQIIGWDWNE